MHTVRSQKTVGTTSINTRMTRKQHVTQTKLFHDLVVVADFFL